MTRLSPYTADGEARLPSPGDLVCDSWMPAPAGCSTRQGGSRATPNFR